MDRERMNLPQEIDDYIKESIDYTLGLPVSERTLEVKLRASEEAQSRLCSNLVRLNSRLTEKDKVIERVKAEANMNAVALKKFVEENQKLASECNHLMSQREKFEREISLYDRDREVLMDFGNEADQRAKEAEARVEELDGQVRVLTDELQYYKRQCEASQVDSSLQEVGTIEQGLLKDVVMTVLTGGDEHDAASARAFLEERSSIEPCRGLLELWTSRSLKPLTLKVLALAAASKAYQKDMEHLKVNLRMAEEEVFYLDLDNKRLLTKYQKEKSCHDSCKKQPKSESAKSNKRKPTSKITSPIEKKIDFSDVEPARQPLSPVMNTLS